MKKQRAADIVVRHLLTQGKRSMRGNVCALRGADGLKCAVGCLIPDKKYYADMDDEPLDDIAEDIVKLSWSFLGQFAIVHDTKAVKNWRKELRRVCVELGVDYNEPLIAGCYYECKYKTKCYHVLASVKSERGPYVLVENSRDRELMIVDVDETVDRLKIVFSSKKRFREVMT